MLFIIIIFVWIINYFYYYWNYGLLYYKICYKHSFFHRKAVECDHSLNLLCANKPQFHHLYTICSTTAILPNCSTSRLFVCLLSKITSSFETNPFVGSASLLLDEWPKQTTLASPLQMNLLSLLLSYSSLGPNVCPYHRKSPYILLDLYFK